MRILLMLCFLLLCWSTTFAQTADQAESWLVLYNTNEPESEEWALWYADQWNIPPGNLLGLNASSSEHILGIVDAQSQIITPVREFLANSPTIESHIMGIILGYKLPGHYESPYFFPAVGGYSLTDALMDMHDDFDEFGNPVMPAYQRDTNYDNPAVFPGNPLMPNERITKSTMLSGRYMTARIDGPNLDSVKQLTIRAKAIKEINEDNAPMEWLWYDYTDECGNWHWLNEGCVNRPEVENERWREFDSDTERIDQIFLRFGWHDINGWDDGRLSPSVLCEADVDNNGIITMSDLTALTALLLDPPDCDGGCCKGDVNQDGTVNGLDIQSWMDYFLNLTESSGRMVLAMNLNSWGATTVRSTSDHNGRYVPNALNAGFAAAIGSTGEPATLICPFPGTIVLGLKKGWTLGEVYYLSKPFDDFMWGLVGDPFLQVTYWPQTLNFSPRVPKSLNEFRSLLVSPKHHSLLGP